jgi:hypothetical protein
MKKTSLFLALALTAVAADNPPRMFRLYQTEVPAESAADLYAAQRDIAGIYQANKAPIPRSAWTSMTGPPMLYYVVPFSGIALMGETTWLQQQGDESSRGARASRLNKVGGATASKIITLEEDLTWTTAPQYAPSAYAMVTVISVKPGKVTDFLAALKEASDTHKKIGKAKSLNVFRVTFGGDGYEYHVAAEYDSLVDLEAGRGFRAFMGEAGYEAYTQKIGGNISSMQRNVLRFRPEFSYAPSK